MAAKITRHTDLEVYRKAMEAAMHIFEASKEFPKEETYSLTDQVRRASRSVCSNIVSLYSARKARNSSNVLILCRPPQMMKSLLPPTASRNSHPEQSSIKFA
jgi:hypothetical protein